MRILAALLCAVTACAIALAEQEIDGIWISGDGDGWIEIILDGDGLSGKIAGSPNDPEGKNPRFDDKNPDPLLRDRALMGLEILGGFKRSAANKWKGGRIYDPNSGKTYKCTITQVDDDTLEVRGFIGISLLGRTETWKRRQRN